MNERGFALPAVMAITTLLFTFITLAAASVVRGNEASELYEERMQVKYATEAGIAKIQQAWALGKPSHGVQLNIDDVMVEVRVEEKEQDRLYITATGHGEKGVHQSISVIVDQKTLAIIGWIG